MDRTPKRPTEQIPAKHLPGAGCTAQRRGRLPPVPGPKLEPPPVAFWRSGQAAVEGRVSACLSFKTGPQPLFTEAKTTGAVPSRFMQREGFVIFLRPFEPQLRSKCQKGRWVRLDAAIFLLTRSTRRAAPAPTLPAPSPRRPCAHSPCPFSTPPSGQHQNRKPS
jgi:hypothetical protein